MSLRLGFWLLISMIAAVGAGKAIISDSTDLDLFWHLRVAQQLHADGVGPLVDRISFSSIKTPWTPYSWLAELGMKWLWDHFGWRVTHAADAVMSVTIVIMLALCCLSLAGKERRLNCVLATVFGAFLTIPYLSFRPVTFAIVLLAIIAWLLLRERRTEKTSRAVWLIVPLTALLANVHLCVIVVPIWVGCLFAGALWEKKNIKHYAALLLLTLLASLATPMLPGAIRTAWFYQAHDVMVQSGIIAEMQPLYQGWGGKITVALLAAVGVVAWVHRDRVRAGEWLWLVAAAVMTLRLGRFAPMLALIASPILAATLPPMNDRVLRKPLIAGVLAFTLLVLGVRIVASFPRSDMPMNRWINRHSGPNVITFPTAAADYVAANITPRRGRLINEFNHGGYLAWRLGDRYQVFLDGRTQLYTPDFWRATYLNDKPDAALLQAADADAAILPLRKSRFRDALIALGWRSAYTDPFAEVLVPPLHRAPS